MDKIKEVTEELLDDHVDDHVDEEIQRCFLKEIQNVSLFLRELGQGKLEA
ncbi:MAG: hypothetical protein V8R75_10015 [Oscillospiraceae bacterium]